jgi:FRG domain
MNGQWMGRYSGSTTGLLVIDLDDMGTHYEGRACAYEDNLLQPSTFVTIRTPDKESAFQLTLETHPIDPRTGEPTSWNLIAPMLPGINFPCRAQVNASREGQALNVNWTTDINTSGQAQLPETRAGEPTEYEPLSDVTNWDRFKAYANDLEHRRYIFRGQKELLRLRTGFHRTGRADLARFLADDIQTLHRHLSLRTSHIFNLNLPQENGAFFDLVQHHGYPTPLLDWTYSPYVAAFFAYHRITNSEAAAAADSDKVRIFMFDQREWRAKFPQIPKLTPCRPHFSIMEFIAIDNQRLVPQQSISSVTNIDDIETYIRSSEREGARYLRIIDLPVRERHNVMRELSIMGITAGSLFPGFDGTCEELKERNFES